MMIDDDDLISFQREFVLIRYFVVETKQKHNRTINMALAVFQNIERDIHTCFAFYKYSNK